MLRKGIILFLVTGFMLAACHSPLYNQTEANAADVKIKMAQARAKSDASAKAAAPVLVKQGSYVDTTPVDLERRPSWLHNHIVINGDQLPFSYYSRTIAAGASSHMLTKYQVGLDASAKVSMNYSGSVKGALDLLASKSGYVYTVRNNSVYWQAFVTKTYDIAFMPGGTDYLMGKSGGGSGSTGSSGAGTVANYSSGDAADSEFSSLKGSLSVWTDLEKTVQQMLTADGKVVVSQSTTSITVRDKPTNVELIGQYIHNLNKSLSKQVLVKVQILEINLQNAFEFGINWDLIAKAFHSSPFVVNANYGTPVAITALTPQSPGSLPQFGTQGDGSTPSYTILFNALNQQGKTSIVTEPRVVCLNNQVSAVRIISSLGYVASIQNTTLSSGGTAPTSTVTAQVTPGTLVTGLTLYILPKIMDDSIYLQVNADLSTNNGFGQFGPSDSQIQLPNVTEKHFNQRSVIHSGDTLILSGFRQLSNTANANQFIYSQALGGKGAQQLNVETVILITPIILNGLA